MVTALLVIVLLTGCGAFAFAITEYLQGKLTRGTGALGIVGVVCLACSIFALVSQSAGRAEQTNEQRAVMLRKLGCPTLAREILKKHPTSRQFETYRISCLAARDLAGPGPTPIDPPSGR